MMLMIHFIAAVLCSAKSSLVISTVTVSVMNTKFEKLTKIENRVNRAQSVFLKRSVFRSCTTNQLSIVNRLGKSGSTFVIKPF
jgi:hypothetical protein